MARNAISLLFLLTAVGIFLMWTDPLIGDIKVLKNQQGELIKILTESRELQKIETDLVASANAIPVSSLERFNKIVPRESETEKLMIELSTIAKNKGVLLKNIDFSIEDGKNASPAVSQSLAAPKKYRTVNIDLNISASYENFRAFLSETEKSLRIIDIDGMVFNSGKTDLYEFNIKAKAYFKPE